MTEQTITLTKEQFDELLELAAKPDQIIRGAKAIGIKISRSDSYVRKVLARAKNTPIRRDDDNSLYVLESDLMRHYFEAVN